MHEEKLITILCYKSDKKYKDLYAPAINGRCFFHALKGEKANANQGVEDLADEIEALREEKQGLLLEDADRAGMKKRFDEIEVFLEGQITGITDYDEVMVRQLVKKITVFDDRLIFEFKAGIETEVQM